MGKVLDLQRELWERVARQARKLGTAGRPSLRKAVQEFEQSFPDTYRQVDRTCFIERTKRSEFFLIGDYHTLPRAQLVAAHFVKYVNPQTLALEIIPSSKQRALDAWSSGTLPASTLLDELAFPSHWGKVPTRGYEVLLEAAREHGCSILALDHPDAGTEDVPAFEEREQAIIDNLRRARPRCLALIGDLHLHPLHIPYHLGGERCLVLHQNHAPYHFRLIEEETSLPALLQVSSGRYVYQHTHPLLVEESCLVALCGDDEAHVASPEEWLPALLHRVCGLLDVPCPEAPTVIATFAPNQRDLLALLVPDKKQATSLLDRLFIQGMSFLSATGPLIVHLPGSNHLAEAAGKWLTITRSPMPPETATRAVHLLAQIRLEAAGFLASLLVNPLRRGKSLAWYRDFLDVKLDWRQTETWFDQLRHAIDEPGAIFPLRNLPVPGAPMALAVTRVLGQQLGRGLYQQIKANHVARAKVLEALFLPLRKTADLPPAVESLHAAAGPLGEPAGNAPALPEAG